MRHYSDLALKNYCTYRIGGTAKNAFFPENTTELIDIVRFHRTHRLPFWIHGGGANTLFPDGEVHTAIISTSAMRATRRSGGLFYAEAGTPMDAWVFSALRQGFGGVECLSGIPGTLGGALFMNAGAYGQEISTHLQHITALTEDNRLVEFPRDHCGFDYRRADTLRHALILSAIWKLPVGDPDVLLTKRKEILARRKEKQPLDSPSAGSVFKRPDGAYASELIDRAGLKGTRIGGAQVSEKHAGFIINVGNATCQDVLELIDLCRRTIHDRFGYELEMEQCLCPAHTQYP